MSTPEIRSPEHTDCLDFIEALRATVPPLHPSATCVVNEMLSDARCASHIGDAHKVVRLMAAIREKVALELNWEAETAEELGDPTTAAALRDQADTFDSNIRVWMRESTPLTFEEFIADDALPSQEQPTADRDYADELPADHRLAITAFINRKSQLGDSTMTDRAANVPPFQHTNEPLQPERISQAVIGTARAATPEHLAKPHQRVTLKNTHECQTHFIQDRNHNHVELRPGQSKEVDMVCDELQNLMRLARTDRGFYESGPNKGLPFPPHPVKVIGLGPKQSAVPQSV